MSPPGRRRYYIWPVRIALLVVCLSLPHGKFFLYVHILFSPLGPLLLWAPLNLSRTRKSLNKAGEIYTATAREKERLAAGCRLLLLRLYGTLILRSLSQDNRLLRCKDKNYESLLNAPAGARSRSLAASFSGVLLFMAHSPASISLPALSRCQTSISRVASRGKHACKCRRAPCTKKQSRQSANRSVAAHATSFLIRNLGTGVHRRRFYIHTHAPTPPKDIYVAVLIVLKFRNKSRLFSSSRRVSLFGARFCLLEKGIS